MKARGSGNRLGWGFAALPLLWGAARAAQSARMPLLAALVLGVALAWVAGFSASHNTGLRVSWPSLRRWYVGDTVALTVAVTNTAKTASPVMVLEQMTPGVIVPDVTVPALAPGETATVRLSLPLTSRRGPLPLQWRLKRHNRLVGLPIVGAWQGSGRPLFAVRPRPDLPPADVVQRLSRPAQDGRAAGVKGSTDPLLLRHFAGGDPVSSVHWRSTARAGTPVVLERERPSDTEVVLLVCCAKPGPGWEATIARAAGLVEACRTAAVPVSVVAALPAAGLPNRADHDAVQDWLAAVVDVGRATPQLLQEAVRRARGGLVAVVSGQPALAGALAAGIGSVQVLDLAQPW